VRYIIYLLSLTEPQVSCVLVVENDTILFYHEGKYHKKKIIIEKPDTYGFDRGFVVVKTNKIIVENNFKTEFYRIRKLKKID
jgi:hypothetical protein